MPETDQRQLHASVDEIRNRWPAVGLAVGVLRRGDPPSFRADGFADIASQKPVTQDTVFRVASISKTFTAIAVMQLCEQGLVDLDGPANSHLRGYQLVPANPGGRPATVRQLLTHTAGVPEWVHPSRMVNSGWFGESFGLRERLPTLAEYYRGGLRLAVEPGTICTYTDHGFATLGQIVQDVSGQPLDRYLRENIFGPLGMADSDLLRSERVQAHLATGYRLGSTGARALTDRQWVTAAASSIYSTPRDMARYVAALVGDGLGEHGAILKPETLAMTFRAYYQPDPRIPGMGLAFFRLEMGRARRRRAPRRASRVQLADLPGTRRRCRCAGLHERVQERGDLADGRNPTAARRPDRRPRTPASARTYRSTRRSGATCAAGTDRGPSGPTCRRGPCSAPESRS